MEVLVGITGKISSILGSGLPIDKYDKFVICSINLLPSNLVSNTIVMHNNYIMMISLTECW